MAVSSRNPERDPNGYRASTIADAGPLRRLRCVDLFAGAGGLSLAAGNVGLEVVAAVEIGNHACATYRHNLVVNEIPRLYETDIRTFDPTKLKHAHFGTGTECDLVLGGPPCQGFSMHWIKDAGVSDPRNNLIWLFMDSGLLA